MGSVKARTNADRANKIVAPTIHDRRRYREVEVSDSAPIKGWAIKPETRWVFGKAPPLSLSPESEIENIEQLTRACKPNQGRQLFGQAEREQVGCSISQFNNLEHDRH